MFSSSPASPSFSPSRHPRDALFSAHSASAVALSVYLIVGSALAVAALVGVGYAQQLDDAFVWWPYAALLAMLLWFALGAWAMKRHQRRLQACARSYDAYVHRHAHAPQSGTAAASLSSDEPWELHAFWSQSLSVAAAPRPTPAAPRATTPARASAHLQTVTQPCARTELLERLPARPVSLFGAYQ